MTLNAHFLTSALIPIIVKSAVQNKSLVEEAKLLGKYFKIRNFAEWKASLFRMIK